ncbi:MAG: amidohydrolase family protein, partial [Chitinophagaceae bacterium]|nr:amidohydrolase family protein [Chitinophagaceae bacterium]
MKYFLFMFFLMGGSIVFGQASPKMDFESYNPEPTLVVPEHITKRAKFPFIDVHNHQFRMGTMDLDSLIMEMEKLNMQVMVNLSGRGGEELVKMVENINTNEPKRFIVFTNINFNGVGEKDWAEKAVKQLETDIKNGANGLKIYKSLGMISKDIHGNRIPVDDTRLDAIWKKAGELKIPVLIHTADPKPFWDEMDEKNERWLELATRPGRKRGPDDPVPFEKLIEEQHNMFKAHPGTTFINAHFGWYPNDLKYLGSLLDKMPNMMIEFGAIIAELGRQPRTAYDFFVKYQDRILFGKDSWVPDEYVTYFRVLETKDEYFPYHKKYHAFWAMYGMGLPDDILKKIYYKNALRIIPGIDATLFP